MSHQRLSLALLLLPLLSLLLPVLARPSDISFTPRWPHRTVTVRHYTLNITSSTLFQSCDPFGPTPIINSSFPGPPLRARAGEILQVRVINSLPPSHDGSNLTMHFHGLSMTMHPVMDGTTMVSQWPIQPGKLFDYRIPLTAEDKGTYFYHSHVGVQAMTAYGALVVEDPVPEYWDPSWATVQWKKDPNSITFHHVYGEEGLEENGKSSPRSPYSWDEDRVLAVGDWFSYSSIETIQTQLGGDPFVWPGSATKLLLNGQSSSGAVVPSCNQTRAALANISCDIAPTSCDTGGQYPTIKLDYDKTYRLRFVGATALMYVSLGILTPTPHPYTSANANSSVVNGTVGLEKLKLIEADGSYLDALNVDRVELTTGQRYSVLYRSKTRDEVERDGMGGVYWMRAESRWRAGPSMWVKLVYPSSSSEAGPPVKLFDGQKDLQLLPAETFGWVTSQLHPLSRKGGPEWWYSHTMPEDDEVTRTVVIDTQQVKFFPSTKGVKWDQNGQAFNESLPTLTPYLVQTFFGDVHFPTASQFETALYNPTSYAYNPTTHSSKPHTSSSSVQIIDLSNKTEVEAARERKWGQGYDAGLNMYFARADEVIDIVLINKPSLLSSSVEIHPWHMHSHKHYTRTIQPGTFSFTRLDQLYSSYHRAESGYNSPIQRDTTVVYASPGAAFLNQTISNPAEEDGGFAVLRYKVDSRNAGVFLLHCHLAYHLQMGMATVWTIAPDQLADRAGLYWGEGGMQGLNGTGWDTFGDDVKVVE